MVCRFLWEGGSVVLGEVVLDVKNLTKRFGQTTILRDVNLSVKSGEVVAVIGPSGAGKRTLLRCVNYLQPFERGEIRLLDLHLKGTEQGFKADRRTLTEVRSDVGMVFQRFKLFPHLSVLDNITLAPSREEWHDDATRHARDVVC